MSDCQTIRYDSPCGPIELQVRRGKLAAAALCRTRSAAGESRANGAGTGRFAQALARYFAGREVGLARSAMDLAEVGPFRRRVYEALMQVPFGQVVTYGRLAGRIGRPRAARAVGQAVGRNPLPLFIPCHRVVAAGNRLGGFGAGLRWKAALLRHEGWTVKDGRIYR